MLVKDPTKTLLQRIVVLCMLAIFISPSANANTTSQHPVHRTHKHHHVAKAATAHEDSEKSVSHGVASYYHKSCSGRRTASGVRYNPLALTAAHRSLPFGTHVRVTNQNTGESVVVTINDRGPFHAKRVIDVSFAAAEQIGLIHSGIAKVQLTVLD